MVESLNCHVGCRKEQSFINVTIFAYVQLIGKYRMIFVIRSNQLLFYRIYASVQHKSFFLQCLNKVQLDKYFAVCNNTQCHYVQTPTIIMEFFFSFSSSMFSKQKSNLQKLYSSARCELSTQQKWSQ